MRWDDWLAGYSISELANAARVSELGIFTKDNTTKQQQFSLAANDFSKRQTLIKTAHFSWLLLKMSQATTNESETKKKS